MPAEKKAEKLRYLQWLLHPADRTPETKTKTGFALSITTDMQTLENWDKDPKFTELLTQKRVNEIERRTYEAGVESSAPDRKLFLEYRGGLTKKIEITEGAAVLAEAIVKAKK